MPAASGHAALLATLLPPLGRSATDLIGWRLLSGGLSGAYTFRLDFRDHALILKAVLPGSAPYIVARGLRELAFLTTLADKIPLQTPQLVAAHQGEDGATTLLLQVYRPVEFSAALYLRFARELAFFHAVFWDQAARLIAYPWLRPPALTGDQEIGEAHYYWRGLREQRRLASVFAGDTWRTLEKLLERIALLDAAIAVLPATLCHGDCHADNLLLDAAGGLVWADWQEACIGRGPEEISFFLQRAGYPTATIPADAMLAAYEQTLAENGVDTGGATIRGVVEASELRRRLLHWPTYMQDAPAEDIVGLISQINYLAERLGIK